MKKVFHFDAPRDAYRCDAAVVWCFDDRFDLAFRKFLKRIGVARPDIIKVAGGAQCLAAPEGDSGRTFVLDQIRLSIRLHATTRVILMVHSDCGGYGGLAAFGGDRAAEAKHHGDDLRRASETVREAFPNVHLDAYFVDFEGVWEPAPAARASGT